MYVVAKGEPHMPDPNQDAISIQAYYACIDQQGNGLINALNLARAFVEGDVKGYYDALSQAQKDAAANGDCKSLLTPDALNEINRAEQEAMDRMNKLHPGVGR
jgi:hypothetical protein